MAKPRELTEVEKFYIENNRSQSNSKIASFMPGIGVSSVKKYKDSLPETSEEAVEQEQDNEVENKRDCKTETRGERMERLAQSPSAGDLMGKRDGVIVMTQQASEVTDARKIIKGQKMSNEQYEKLNRNKIHRPKGNE